MNHLNSTTGMVLYSVLVSLFIFAAVVMSPLRLYALDESIKDQFSSNSINDYERDFAGFCSTGGLSLYGDDNLQKLYNYFLGKGLSKVQAAAAIGNIAHESIGAKDPFVVERNASHPELPKSTQKPSELPVVGGWPGGQTRQPGWGLIQWTPAGKFAGIADQVGVSEPYDLGSQAQVIWWHMENTAPTGVKNFNATYRTINEIEQATRYFMEKMLAPNAAVAGFPDRLRAAELALDYAAQPGEVGGVGGEATCIGNGAVAGNAIKTALTYAWPEYHPPNYLKMTPSYAAAVRKAQTDGKYVGGAENPGIDCNGFISRVMEDSGVDPTYNSTESGASAGRNTVAQLQYLRSSGKYEEYTPETALDVTPGSIAINNDHTYFIVGKQEGFETQVASASYSQRNTNWRAPMAGKETLADTDYNWFRLK